MRQGAERRRPSLQRRPTTIAGVPGREAHGCYDGRRRTELPIPQGKGSPSPHTGRATAHNRASRPSEGPPSRALSTTPPPAEHGSRARGVQGTTLPSQAEGPTLEQRHRGSATTPDTAADRPARGQHRPLSQGNGRTGPGGTAPEEQQAAVGGGELHEPGGLPDSTRWGAPMSAEWMRGQTYYQPTPPCWHIPRGHPRLRTLNRHLAGLGWPVRCETCRARPFWACVECLGWIPC
jgi:hypothetical protein